MGNQHNSSHPNKNSNQLGGNKARRIGYIENASVDEKTDLPKFSPRINFPNSNLVYGPNGEIGLKTAQAGFHGAQRFEEGEKSLNVPGRVIEQWLDAVLEEQDDLALSELARNHEDGTKGESLA